MHWYNENDKFASRWLSSLASADVIPHGTIDFRSIAYVAPADILSYTQCHFFAGIGGWAEALRLAGWPTDQPVWTGSCPCQPFSMAGKKEGTKDARHLWPMWYDLICECKPPTIFGEQVAGPLGRTWLNGVFADLEAVGYAVAGADLCAASVNAPHIRQRLWWVAQSQGERQSRRQPRLHGSSRKAQPYGAEVGGLGDANFARPQNELAERSIEGRTVGQPGASYLGLGNASRQGSGRDSGAIFGAQAQSDQPWKETWRFADEPELAGAWDNYAIVECTDGKARRVESGIQPLAHGVSGRVGRLRGYGNAIVPQVAAEFIKAFMEVEGP